MAALLALLACGPGVSGDPNPAREQGDAAAAGVHTSRAWVVAVGNHGRRVVIRDPRTGEATAEGGEVDNVFHNLIDLAYADGLLVAVGGGCEGGCRKRIMVFDRVAWHAIELPPEAQAGWLASVAYGRGRWVALSGVKAGGALVSRDGWRWELVPDAPGSVRKVVFGRVGGEDMFVAVGQNLRRARSLDGVHWTDVAGGGVDEPDLHGLGIGNGWALAGAADGRRLRTADGVTWLDDAARGRSVDSVLYWGGRFFAYEEAGILHLSSDDGGSWMQASTNQSLNRVVAGVIDGRDWFLGLAWPNHVKASNDGITWTTLLPPDGEGRALRAIGIVPAP